MGHILATLFGLIGIGSSQEPPAPEMQPIDPASILFSISTIADDLPPVAPGNGDAGAADLMVNEDDWRQIEFFPAGRLAEIQAMVGASASFEAEHRDGAGFRQIYIRRLPAAAVLTGADALGALERDLGAGPRGGLVLYSGAATPAGRVANGFSLPLGGGAALYGFRSAAGIAVLGAELGEGPDQAAVTRAFATLNARHGLIAVDWRSHIILTGVAADGSIEVWRPD